MTVDKTGTRKYRTRLGVKKGIFSITMPVLIRSRLAEMADLEQKSMSNIITSLVIDYINKKEIEMEEIKTAQKKAMQEIKNRL